LTINVSLFVRRCSDDAKKEYAHRIRSKQRRHYLAELRREAVLRASFGGDSLESAVRRVNAHKADVDRAERARQERLLSEFEAQRVIGEDGALGALFKQQ
jgi:hypothetical protein